MSEPVLAPPEAPVPPRSRAAARQRWVERLARFADAGLSAAQFCAAEGVSVASFYLWKRRLAAPDFPPGPASPGPPAAPRLLPVRLAAPAPGIELVLPGGAVLRLGPGADEATLRGLLRLLGVRPC